MHDFPKYYETERLILREWKEGDLPLLLKMNQDEEVMKYFPATLSKEENDLLASKLIHHFDEYGYGAWAAEEKTSGRFMGLIGLSHPSFEASFTPCVEIAWRLHKAFWNKGYATEGAIKVLDIAFRTLGIEEVYSFTTLQNIPSEKVMKKIGMKKLGTFIHPNLPDHAMAEHCLYLINKEEYDLLSNQRDIS